MRSLQVCEISMSKIKIADPQSASETSELAVQEKQMLEQQAQAVAECLVDCGYGSEAGL